MPVESLHDSINNVNHSRQTQGILCSTAAALIWSDHSVGDVMISVTLLPFSHTFQNWQFHCVPFMSSFEVTAVAPQLKQTAFCQHFRDFGSSKFSDTFVSFF